MDQVELQVSEMSCAACSGAVEKALSAVQGVQKASVAFTTGRATIIGSDLDPQSLAQASTDAGYPAVIADEGIDPAAMACEIEQKQHKNATEWKRRAIIGLVLWVPAESLHWLAEPLGIDGAWLPWMMLIVSSAAMILVGTGFIRSAYKAAKLKQTNMDTLISIGATAAYGFSLFIFIANYFGYEADHPVYFTEAAALLAIISLGHWLEANATAKAGSSIRELLRMQPDEGEIQNEDGTTTIIPSGEVVEGMKLLVRPGGRIPVDGEVIDGVSEVDESIVTGEPLPVIKEVGDLLIAGSMNTTGQLVLLTTVDGRHTTISRIAALVAEAQSSKAGMQRLADKVAGVFVPIVLLIAAVTVIGWSLFGDIETGIVSAVTVLVISCPCALGLATPMAVMVATGEASLRGILVKDAAALELAGKTKTCVFDKTGTLTMGTPSVSSIECEGSFSQDDVIQIAASVEKPSEHPIANAIVNEAQSRNLPIKAVSSFKAIAGTGVSGQVDGQEVAVIRDDNASCKVEVDGKLIGRIVVSDEIRKTSKETVFQLQMLGIQVHMLTGDRIDSANAVADQIGISREHVHADATPEDKTRIVSELPKPSMMVGDGINDAAALAAADIGVAIASGTNVAMETASIVIPANNIEATAESILLSRKTLTTIKQNLVFAFMYNVAAIPLAAFGILGPHGPLIAAVAMGCSDITVIGNALRLKNTLRRRRNVSK